MMNTQKKQRPIEMELEAQMRGMLFSRQSIVEATEKGTPRQLEYLHRSLMRSCG